MNELDEKVIGRPLRRKVNLRVVPETGSTSDDLKEAARRGDADYSVLIASKQRNGRGREGRTFHSASGLYMSLLLPWRADSAPFVTHLAAVAVARAIADVTGKDATVKWVNDVFVQGKKVCGILTENVATERGRRLIVGIGVNAGTPESALPEELKKIAGTLSCDKNMLAAAILNGFFDRFDAFSAAKLRREYESLCFLIGKKVVVSKGEESREGVATTLSDSLGLVVSYEDGSSEELISGEVRVKSIV